MIKRSVLSEHDRRLDEGCTWLKQREGNSRLMGLLGEGCPPPSHRKRLSPILLDYDPFDFGWPGRIEIPLEKGAGRWERLCEHHMQLIQLDSELVQTPSEVIVDEENIEPVAELDCQLGEREGGRNGRRSSTGGIDHADRGEIDDRAERGELVEKARVEVDSGMDCEMLERGG